MERFNVPRFSTKDIKELLQDKFVVVIGDSGKYIEIIKHH